MFFVCSWTVFSETYNIWLEDNLKASRVRCVHVTDTTRTCVEVPTTTGPVLPPQPPPSYCSTHFSHATIYLYVYVYSFVLDKKGGFATFQRESNTVEHFESKTGENVGMGDFVQTNLNEILVSIQKWWTYLFLFLIITYARKNLNTQVRWVKYVQYGDKIKPSLIDLQILSATFKCPLLHWSIVSRLRLYIIQSNGTNALRLTCSTIFDCLCQWILPDEKIKQFSTCEVTIIIIMM